MTYTAEIFDSLGTMAIMKDGLDVLHVRITETLEDHFRALLR